MLGQCRSFHSFRVDTVASTTATRNGNRPADSISSTGVSPFYRMRGHTAHIIPPSRLCAVSISLWVLWTSGSQRASHDCEGLKVARFMRAPAIGVAAAICIMLSQMAVEVAPARKKASMP